MGIINRDGALYIATGVDTTGFYAGRREAMGIIKAMASPITSFDVFSGIGISAATAFASAAKSVYNFEKEFHKNMLEVATSSNEVKRCRILCWAANISAISKCLEQTVVNSKRLF